MRDWLLFDFPSETKALAEEAAERAGLTVAEWLARAIDEQRQSEAAVEDGPETAADAEAATDDAVALEDDTATAEDIPTEGFAEEQADVQVAGDIASDEPVDVEDDTGAAEDIASDEPAEEEAEVARTDEVTADESVTADEDSAATEVIATGSGAIADETAVEADLAEDVAPTHPLDRFLADPLPDPTRLPLSGLRESSYQHEFGFDDLDEGGPGSASDADRVIARAAPDEDGAFEVVIGSRRWQAAEAAGGDDLPVIVLDLTDQEVIRLILLEVVGRGQMPPIAAAESYRWLLSRGEVAEDDLGGLTGLSAQEIRDRIALLSLPGRVVERLESGELDVDRAIALVDAAYAEPVSRIVIGHDLSLERTRAVEALTNRLPAGSAAETETIARELSTLLDAEVRVAPSIDDTAVTLRVRPAGGGRAITYRLQGAAGD